MPLSRCLAPLALSAATLSAGAVAAGASAGGARHDGAAGGFPPSFEGVHLPGDFVFPVDMAFAENGDLYVAEKRGRVYAYVGGTLQAAPLLNIEDDVNNAGSRGLLALALHPGFVPDGGPTAWLYVAFTETGVPGQDVAYQLNDQFSHGVLVRYPVDVVGADLVADAGAAQYLLGARLPDGTAPDAFASLYTSHASCALLFGTDGTLLVAHGDGAHHDTSDKGGLDDGGFDDFVHPVTGLRGQLPKEQDSGAFRSQDLRSLSGKVLRLNPATGMGLASNPFFDGDPASNASRVWALGLRNPFRLSLVPGTGSADPAAADPGTLIVGDVGATRFEELEWVDAPGLNFGWPCREGNALSPDFVSYSAPDPNPFGFPDCATPEFGIPADPIVGYHHFDAALSFPAGAYVDGAGLPLPGLTGACVIGGAVYPGGAYPPEYDGRYFFGDYSDDCIKTLEIDANGSVVAIRDFAQTAERVVDIEAHPLTGDLHYLDMGVSWFGGHVTRVRYGENLSPAAVLAVDAPSGSSPHAVVFDGSASTDPEGLPLTYRWDFDDGSALVETSTPSVAHVYTDSGVYHPWLRVSDPEGLFDETTTLVAVDSLPPAVSIDAPQTGSAVDPDALTLDLFGSGFDVSGGSIDFHWQLNLHHNVHVHPDVFSAATSSASATQATATLDPHGGSGVEIVFYEVRLTATQSDGGSAHDTAWYFPSDELLDPVGSATLVSRLDELVPPEPQGSGHPDIEVVRDGVAPNVAGGGEYFSTEHGGDQGDDDWIGLELVARPEPYARFVSVTFTEGPHLPSGGWFEDVTVEIFSGGVWAEADDVVVDPPYPVGDPGVDYETFTFHFTPRYGEGVRLRGEPGGTVGYITCSELRARMVTSAAYEVDRRDLSTAGSIGLLVDYLSPPGSLGFGNPDSELLRNGTLPATGSDSAWAQFSTFHDGDQGDEDWIGYRFAEPQTIQSILFQEGLHFANGGWFESIEVESRVEPSGPWSPVVPNLVDPPFSSAGQGGLSYETFEFDFDPVIARDVRLVGAPGGVDGFVTVGELRVYGPWFDEDVCGNTVFGEVAPFGVTMAIASTTPPLLGHPILVEVTDAAEPEVAVGAMVVGLAETFIPLGFSTLLVHPLGTTMSPAAFDAAGECDWFATIPTQPALSGVTLYLQAGRLAPTFPGGLRLSQGLRMTLCQ